MFIGPTATFVTTRPASSRTSGAPPTVTLPWYVRTPRSSDRSVGPIVPRRGRSRPGGQARQLSVGRREAVPGAAPAHPGEQRGGGSGHRDRGRTNRAPAIRARQARVDRGRRRSRPPPRAGLRGPSRRGRVRGGSPTASPAPRPPRRAGRRRMPGPSARGCSPRSRSTWWNSTSRRRPVSARPRRPADSGHEGHLVVPAITRQRACGVREQGGRVDDLADELVPAALGALLDRGVARLDRGVHGCLARPWPPK